MQIAGPNNYSGVIKLYFQLLSLIRSLGVLLRGVGSKRRNVSREAQCPTDDGIGDRASDLTAERIDGVFLVLRNYSSAMCVSWKCVRFHRLSLGLNAISDGSEEADGERAKRHNCGW